MAGHGRRSESNALSKRKRIEGQFHVGICASRFVFAYIARCADGSLYVGHASNLRRVNLGPQRRSRGPLDGLPKTGESGLSRAAFLGEASRSARTPYQAMDARL